MTVCVVGIASLQGEPVLVGASDRMVTAGDIEFEQEQRKFHILTRSISIMVAGDLTVQAEVLHAVNAHRNHEAEENPNDWLTVKQVADWFYDALGSLIRKRAERTILWPLGLDFSKLTSTEVAPQLANDLSKEILAFEIAPIQAIVFGLDPTGAHIYEVNNSGISCQDWTGFSSIGGGAWHANSQMIFGEHVKAHTMAETMMLIYSSKKRAEVAPGVGRATDMIVIGPELGQSAVVGYPIMSELEQTFQKVQDEARQVREKGNAKISEYIEEVIREAAAIDPATPAGELQSETNAETYAGHTEAAGEEASD